MKVVVHFTEKNYPEGLEPEQVAETLARDLINDGYECYVADIIESPVKEEDISNLRAIRDMLVDQMDVAVAEWHVEELESWRQSLNDVLAHLVSE